MKPLEARGQGYLFKLRLSKNVKRHIERVFWDALMRVSALLKAWADRAAEQLNPTTVWRLACGHLKRTIANIGPSQPPVFLANHANGIG